MTSFGTQAPNEHNRISLDAFGARISNCLDSIVTDTPSLRMFPSLIYSATTPAALSSSSTLHPSSRQLPHYFSLLRTSQSFIISTTASRVGGVTPLAMVRMPRSAVPDSLP